MTTPDQAREPHDPSHRPRRFARVVRVECPAPSAHRQAKKPVAPRMIIATRRDHWARRAASACQRVSACIVRFETSSACEAGLWRLGPITKSESPGSLVLVIDRDFPACEGLIALARRVGCEVVLSVRGAAVDDAVWGIRLGVGDMVDREETTQPQIAERFRAAGARSGNLRGEQQRAFALSRLCGPSLRSCDDIARQPSLSCSDAVQAYQELAPTMHQVNTATEFTGLIKGELDIEALLRTTLEFVLARSGPTNAAVFLPTTSGDYSLGAYVNYDCPKDTCDVLLDHLANVIAPKFERTTGMVHLTTRDQLDNYIADEADWLAGSHVAGFACRHQGEVLAIFMLFRDQRSPYSAGLLEQVKTVGELFAAQLARVIHIHHRHLPKDKWGMLGDPEKREDDYGDLAA